MRMADFHCKDRIYLSDRGTLMLSARYELRADIRPEDKMGLTTVTFNDGTTAPAFYIVPKFSETPSLTIRANKSGRLVATNQTWVASGEFRDGVYDLTGETMTVNIKGDDVDVELLDFVGYDY